MNTELTHESRKIADKKSRTMECDQNAFFFGMIYALTNPELLAAQGLSNMVWVIESEKRPTLGGYYYCLIDTKNDCIVKTIVEWSEFKNGEHTYYDWDFEGIEHLQGFSEEAEVIKWLDESNTQRLYTKEQVDNIVKPSLVS